MNAKRISAVIIIIIVALVPLISFISGFSTIDELPKITRNNFFALSETFLKDNLPFNTTLRQNVVALKYAVGSKKQNNIFISKNYLLEDVKNPDIKKCNSNTKAIIDFADTYRVPTYAMIIPTSCAIKQQEIEQIALSQLYNQKTFIEGIYKDFEGNVSSVNVYPALFAKNSEYIYYKTESNLTSLGGYYVYDTLATRLNLKPATIDRFEIEYLPYDYYGDIYAKSPHKDISPDLIMTYNFSKFRREYKVTRTIDGEINTYYELYPKEVISTGSPLDVFLGGPADKIDIVVSSPNKNKILIYGDKTALTYIPFLATNCDKITYIDLSTAKKELLDEIDIKSYDQVVFGFSSDTYMHNDYLKILNTGNKK